MTTAWTVSWATDESLDLPDEYPFESLIGIFSSEEKAKQAVEYMLGTALQWETGDAVLSVHIEYYWFYVDSWTIDKLDPEEVYTIPHHLRKQGS